MDQINTNAARSEALDFDDRDYGDRLRAGLRPEVIKSLNSKKTSSNIPSQYRTLCAIAANYDYEILLQTELPWITVIRPPGNALLISPSELKREIEAKESLAITYGVGPWSSWSVINRIGSEDYGDDLIIAISDWEQPRYGSFRDDDEEVIASLREHFSAKDENNDWQEAYMLKAILCLVENAWSLHKERLADIDWTRRRDNWLATKFKKSDLI